MSAYRKETVSFRLLELEGDLLPVLTEAIEGIEVKTKRHEESDRLVVTFDLEEKRDYDKLCRFIVEQKIPRPNYGIWISLVTEADSGGAHVPAYVIELVQRIGGQIDFSFVSI